MINSIRWIEEPEDVRAKFIEKFDLKKSGGRIVENNKLISDGISGEELYKKFTVKALQNFTGGYEITDVYELFSIAAAIIKAELHPNEKSISTEEAYSPRPTIVADEATAGTAKKRGRPKKEKG